MSGFEFFFFLNVLLTTNSVHPCGQVFQGLLERDTVLVTNITGQQGDTVDILVENMGRVNFGSKINDYKAREQNLNTSSLHTQLLLNSPILLTLSLLSPFHKPQYCLCKINNNYEINHFSFICFGLTLLKQSK